MRSNKINIIASLFQAFAYESITVDTTVKSLTTATFTDADNQTAKRAFITAETAAMRFRIDGTDPSSTEGHVLNVNDILSVTGSDNIRNFRITRKDSTNGIIKVTYGN